jgi:hypothetical protein
MGIVALLPLPRLAETQSSPSSTGSFHCSNEDAQKGLVAAIKLAKNDLANGRFEKSQREAKRVQKSADLCIQANEDTDAYHYMHSFATMIEAQDQLATGNQSGLSTFMDASSEAKELADKPNADPDLRKMAKDEVDGAHYVMREIESAKYGDLIRTPPPPPGQ